ncbi:MAG: glycosyltransferase family 4 protein [Candidatus Thermoplasmatota archaeon]
MKILFITNQFNPPRSSGSGNSSSLIFHQLKDRGHEVDLLIFDDEKYKKRYRETRYGEDYRERKYLATIEELSKISDGDYDIIHQYGGAPAKYILPVLGKDFEYTKIVTTFNGIYPACWNYEGYGRNDRRCCRFPKNFRCIKKSYEGKNPLFLPFLYMIRKTQKRLAKKFDKIFTQSEAIKVLFSKSGYNTSKIEIVPNFYDPSLYDSIRKQDVKESDKIKITYVGKIEEHKGIDDLVQAFLRLEDENVELRIIGKGTEKKKLEDRYSKKDEIKFLGKIPYASSRLIKSYKESDIFVHPGLWPEPFNRTILEAAVSKNAIIVSDVGAPPEVLEESALTYPPGEVEGLSAKLKRLIDDGEKREELAEKSHDLVIGEYSIGDAIDELEKEYKKLLV